MTKSSSPNIGLVISRFLFLLGLAVWLGGLAFVAVGAPAMFKVSKFFGPQMVGAAMGSFTIVTYICAVLLLIGWGAERSLTRANNDKAWQAQGICIGIMIAVAGYLGAAVMPEMVALQPKVVAANKLAQQPTAITGRPAAASAPAALAAAAQQKAVALIEMKAAKVRVDKAHKTYRSATSLVVLLGLTTLFLFCLRISRIQPLPNGEVPLREGSIFTTGSI
jgi:hypothetical protein